MRSSAKPLKRHAAPRLAWALALAAGCSYDWDGLRPGATFVPDAAVGDVVTPADVVDAAEPTDAVTPSDVVTPMDVVTPTDVVVAPDVVVAMDVVDAPPARDVVDVPVAMDVQVPRDVVDVPPAVDRPDVVDVPVIVDTPDVVIPPADTGPTCTGLSCPCHPGNPMGYCLVGRRCMSGACATTVADGALVITEIMNDTDNPVSEPEGEWLEVYNPAPYAVDLRGMRVRDLSAMSAITSTGPALLVLPLGYAVIARSANLGISGGPAVALATYDMITLNNSGTETVTLSTAEDVAIDSVSYGAGWPNTPGRSKSLRPGILDATMNNSPTNWCASGTNYTTSNFGSPGEPNSCM